jgi:hypothetical protein
VRHDVLVLRLDATEQLGGDGAGTELIADQAKAIEI